MKNKHCITQTAWQKKITSKGLPGLLGRQKGKRKAKQEKHRGRANDSNFKLRRRVLFQCNRSHASFFKLHLACIRKPFQLPNYKPWLGAGSGHLCRWQELAVRAQPRQGAAPAQCISTLIPASNSIFHRMVVPLDPLFPHLLLAFTSHLPLSWKSRKGQLSRSDCQQQVPHPQPCPCLTCLQISGMGAMVWKEKQKCSVAFQSKWQLFSNFLLAEKGKTWKLL